MPYYVSDNNLTPISKVKKANNMSSRANKIDLFAIQNIFIRLAENLRKTERSER